MWLWKDLVLYEINKKNSVFFAGWQSLGHLTLSSRHGHRQWAARRHRRLALLLVRVRARVAARARDRVRAS